jgi:hypothetical protein
MPSDFFTAPKSPKASFSERSIKVMSGKQRAYVELKKMKKPGTSKTSKPPIGKATKQPEIQKFRRLGDKREVDPINFLVGNRLTCLQEGE